MFNLLVLLLLQFSTFRTHVANVTQTHDLLSVSVLIHAKEYKVDPKTFARKYVRIGCSGTYIGPSTVLTAAHCFEYATQDIWIRSPGEASRRAIVVKIDPAVDLALLSVLGPLNHAYAVLSPKSQVGESVIVVGSPFGFEFLVSEGIVAKTHVPFKPEFKATYLVHTAMINSGSSGGGAFNEQEQLLGVNTMTIGGLFGWCGISLAVDSDTIQKFLK